MKTMNNSTTNDSGTSETHPPLDNMKGRVKARKDSISRRSFLGKSLAVGAGTLGVGLLRGSPIATASRDRLTPPDAALLRFPAALEIIEADFWIQYNELGGVQDDEVPGGSGNPDYAEALKIIEDEMGDYI